nr:hypothetical protein [Angustibacter aerolatus]
MRRRLARTALLAAACLLAGLVTPASAGAASVVTETVDVPRHSDVVTALQRAADSYRGTASQSPTKPAGWSWGTYFDGVHEPVPHLRRPAVPRRPRRLGHGHRLAARHERDEPRHGEGRADLLRRLAGEQRSEPGADGRADAGRPHRPPADAVLVVRRALHGAAGLDALGDAARRHRLPRQDGPACSPGRATSGSIPR